MCITIDLNLRITRESPKKTYRKGLFIWRKKISKTTKRKNVLPFEMHYREKCGISLKTSQKTTTLRDIIPTSNNKRQWFSKGIGFGIT